jgi:large-conductance mechanosensitive channel
MDNQQIFNFVVAIAAFLAVFVFNQTTRKIQKLEDESAAMRENLLKDYVQKDDYKADIKEIKDILRQIFDKLDSKQDK